MISIRTSKDNERFGIFCHESYHKICKTIPGYTWNPEAKAWVYSASPTVALLIRNTLKHIEMKCDAPFRVWLQMGEQAYVAAQQIQNIHGDHLVQPPLYNKDFPLWKHQLRAFYYVVNLFGGLENPHGGGAMIPLKMGRGKSSVAIHIIANFRFPKVLIVAPSKVVSVWPDEFDKHDPLGCRVLALRDGSIKKRAKQAEEHLRICQEAYPGFPAVIVLNYEAARQGDLAQFTLRNMWDCVILDEIHRCKSPQSQTAKWAGLLGRRAKFRLGLSGTPMPHAIPTDSLVLTPTGWKCMGDIHCGDSVIGGDGNVSKVIGVWPQGEREIFVVKFSDGTSAKCTADHLWQVNSRGRISRGLLPLIKRTDELANPAPFPGSKNKYRFNGRQSVLDSSGAARWSIPLVSAVNFSQMEVPIDPYVMGLLLGDGTMGHVIGYVTADSQLSMELEKLLPIGDKLSLHRGGYHGKAIDYRITKGFRGPLPPKTMQAINDLGLRWHKSHEKFVPDCYLWNSAECRLSVLQGLCDTDGCAYHGSARYVTTSIRLAQDVLFIIRSLGGFAKLSKYTRRISKLPNGKTCAPRPIYSIYFTLPLNPFRLKRKLEKYNILKSRQSRKGIIDIQSSGFSETQCITIDNDTGLFVINDFIVTHNSPLDIFAQYRFLDISIFGSSWTKFKTHHAVLGGYNNYQVLQYKNLDELNQKFYSIAYRMKDEEDVVKRDEPLHIYRKSKLGKGKNIYWSMYNHMVAEVKEGVATAGNALTKLLRLQQITGGHLKDEDGVIHDVDQSKAELLEDVLEDLDLREPIVIFCRFHPDMDVCKSICEASGRTVSELSRREDTKQEWVDGKTDVLISQIQSGKEGISLVRANYTIYYSIGFSLGDFDQSVARTDRPGQDAEKVTCIHLILDGTVDEQVYKAIQERRNVVKSVLEDMQAS